MRSLTGLTIILLLSAALAGCADAPTYLEPSNEGLDDHEDSENGNQTSGNQTDEAQGNHTMDGNVTHDGNATANNTAPEASLEASAINGTAPLNVTFTLDGSDADGDNLTWTLSVDGSEIAAGVDLPAEVEHTFEAGNWTVDFVVSDGNATAAVMLQISAETEVAEVFVPTRLEGPVDSGSTPLGADVGALQCVGWLAGENGLDCRWFAMTPAFGGHSFTTVTGNTWLEFFDSCDGATATSLGITSGSGVIPDGALCMVVWYFGLAPTGSTVAVDVS